MFLKSTIKRALHEDIGRGDLFALEAKNKKVKAAIICKQDSVFGGEKVVKKLCKYKNIKLKLYVKDGDRVKEGEVICHLQTTLLKLLRVERTLVNFIQHISGIATKTREFVDELKGLDVVLLDTRKTHPGLREIDKYAVRCGGGTNHRMGLDDCLLIQESHLKGMDDLELFIKNIRKKMPFTANIEIECDNIEDAKKFMKSGADIVMCDHMSPKELKEVVAYRDAHHKDILIEGTGNITVKTAREYGLSGVDAISTGSSIYKATWIDYSIKIVEE